MAALVVQQFVSADGFAADDRGEFTLFDSIEGSSHEFDAANLEWLDRVGAIVLGRVTYEMFASYWPTPAAEAEIIEPRINALPKHVFTRSLQVAPWGDHEPAQIHSSNAVEELRGLKESVPGDLVLWGSLELSATFFGSGLVDVVRLVALPRAIGAGRGVFPGEQPVRLRLLGSRTFDDLLVATDYAVVSNG